MALIKCTNCGATISDKAKFCPKCGSQVEHDNLIEETDEAPKRKKTAQVRKSVDSPPDMLTEDHHRTVHVFQ